MAAPRYSGTKRIINAILALAIVSITCHAYAGGGKFAPPEGKRLLIIGQDIDSIDAYVSAANIVPAGFMAYTSIQNTEGIYEPADYGAGVQHMQYLVEKYPGTIIQIGLYMAGGLDGVIVGSGDQNIDLLGRWIKESGRPVFLRIGYEFDYPGNGYEPAKYIKAFRYIVDRLRKASVENVAYVWHSYASKIERSVMDWYPGDEYTDWFGISFFGKPNEYMDAMAGLAKRHNKPLMIAESAPHGIGAASPDARHKWYKDFFGFISEKDVKAVCYINTDWDACQMWKGLGWGDSRIQANSAIRELWLAEVKKEEYINNK